MSKDKYNRKTAISRTSPSKPYRLLLEKGLITGRVLDFGCGKGKDVEDLVEKSYNAHGYDPAHHPVRPHGKFNTILATYVLNIILHPADRSKTIREIRGFLKEGGSAYVTVRRDVPKEGTFSQRWIELRAPFKSLVKTSAFEIYQLEK